MDALRNIKFLLSRHLECAILGRMVPVPGCRNAAPIRDDLSYRSMQSTVCVHPPAAPISCGGLDCEVVGDFCICGRGLAVQQDFDVYTKSFRLSGFCDDHCICASSNKCGSGESFNCPGNIVVASFLRWNACSHSKESLRCSHRMASHCFLSFPAVLSGFFTCGDLPSRSARPRQSKEGGTANVDSFGVFGVYRSAPPILPGRLSREVWILGGGWNR